MISNAYDMLELLRDNVGEASPAHWSDLNLLRRINQAYYEVARLISMSAGQWLVKSASVTPVASVITLPDDCSKPLYLEKSNGEVISWLNSVAQRRVSRTIGTTLAGGRLEAYPLMNTIEVNEDSFTTACTLWYQQKVVDLITGTGRTATGSMSANELDLEADLRNNVEDDYYNGATIEVVDGTGIGSYTVSDYDAGDETLTLNSGTFSDDSVYGLVPITPSECNDFIILRATVLAMSKPSANLDEKVFQMFMQDAREAKRDLKEWIEVRIIENSGITIGEHF